MISIRPVWPWFLVLILLALISGCDRTPVSPATAAPASKDLPRTASTFTGAKKGFIPTKVREVPQDYA